MLQLQLHFLAFQLCTFFGSAAVTEITLHCKKKRVALTQLYRVISVAVTYYRLRNHKNCLKYSGTSKISIGRDYKNV